MKRPVKTFIFPVIYIALAFLISVPYFMIFDDRIYEYFRKIRPIADISRDLWLWYYRRASIVSIALVLLVCLAAYCLETFVFSKASIGRLILHIALLVIIMGGTYMYISIFLPFDSNMTMWIYGSLFGLLTFQSIIYLFCFPPTNYKSIFR